MANEPTMQNSRIVGIRTLRGTRMSSRADLIAAQPAGTMKMLARMKIRKTA